MCFSAPASFLASGSLAALGGVSLAAAKKEDRIIAAVPLMFGIQQAFEGVQWLYLGAGTASLPAGYGFLLFALIVWPLYVPFLAFRLDEERRTLMKWFMILGAAVAIYFLILLAAEPILIHELRACVAYSFAIPFKHAVLVAYLSAVFGPLLLSSKKIFRMFGIAIAFLAMAAWIFYSVAFISVWCFFAAIVSSMFFAYVIRDSLRKKPRGKQS